MEKRRILSLLGVLAAGIVLSACSLVAKPADLKTENPNVTLTGQLSSVAGKFSLSNKGISTDLDSRTVDLSSFVGKTVTVTGQYSGTTLFVDSAN